MTEDRKPETSGMAEVLAKSTPAAEASAKNALADKPIPQDTLLPLLDAPLDELAAYLAGHTWEARKNYLNNMMGDSLDNLFKQVEFFQEKGISTSEYTAITDCCLIGLHVKIGRLLDAWGEPESPDVHATALYSLSASSEHRCAMAKWMPGGTTCPPAEAELFEPTCHLAIFRRLSLMFRPGLAECWRQHSGRVEPWPQ